MRVLGITRLSTLVPWPLILRSQEQINSSPYIRLVLPRPINHLRRMHSMDSHDPLENPLIINRLDYCRVQMNMS